MSPGEFEGRGRGQAGWTGLVPGSGGVDPGWGAQEAMGVGVGVKGSGQGQEDRKRVVGSEGLG